MITIGDKQFRNLEEQVRRNQEDIQFILEEEGVLNQFGIKVVGQVDTEGELPDASTYQGDYGDAYAVGTQPPYELYIYTREFSGETGPQWFNIGQFPIPSTVPGPTGATGPTGPTGTRGSKWTSSTSLPGEGAGTAGVAGDQYLYVGSNSSYNGNVYQYGTGGWELQGNIRGPQGIQGIQGPVGPTGPKGDVGPQGATGPVGQSFQIIGVLTTSSQLPDPSTVPDSYAYLVGSTENYDLYVQVVGENEWVNVGKVEGVVGPQGPVGPTGTTGPAGIVYIKPVESNVIPVAGKGYNLLAMREFSSTPKVGDYFLLIWKGILDIEGRTWATIQEVTEIDGTRVRSVPSGVVETTGAQGEAGPMGPTGPAGGGGSNIVFAKSVSNDSGSITSLFVPDEVFNKTELRGTFNFYIYIPSDLDVPTLTISYPYDSTYQFGDVYNITYLYTDENGTNYILTISPDNTNGYLKWFNVTWKGSEPSSFTNAPAYNCIVTFTGEVIN